MEIEILYKDKDLLICKKPAGVASQPDATGQSDLLTALSEKYKNVSLIHRLDLPPQDDAPWSSFGEVLLSLG